jgi:SAM-dependent methyltransferase
VLPAGLPDEVNEALHRWHMRIVSERVLPRVPLHGRLLDLGCGYGRIGEAVSQVRPDVEVMGLDLSMTYCRFYRDSVGTAVCGDLSRLPFADTSCDAALAITSLMYLNPQACERAVGEITRCLRRDGVALFVDPGLELITLLRSLRLGKASATGGGGFRKREYARLLRREGFVDLESGGNPFFTFLLPAALPLHAMGMRVGRMLDSATRADLSWKFRSRLSLHRWILMRREI